jgi:hypothetical protein
MRHPAPARRRILMAHTQPPACPVCGADAPPVRDVLAALAERRDQARAAAQGRAEPGPPRPGGGPGTGTGEGITVDEFFLGAAAAVAGGVVRGLWRKTAKPFAGSVLAQLKRRGQAGMEAARSAADRHPELLCCARDQIVFLAGGRRTVPAGDAMRLLVRGDDAGLVAALGEGG